MKQLNKLREALRGHYDSREYPGAGEGWEQARSLIEAKRRTAGRRRFAALALGAGAICIGGWLTFDTIQENDNLLSSSFKRSVAEQKAEPLPGQKRAVPSLSQQSAYRPGTHKKPGAPVSGTLLGAGRFQITALASNDREKEPSEQNASALTGNQPPNIGSSYSGEETGHMQVALLPEHLKQVSLAALEVPGYAQGREPRINSDFEHRAEQAHNDQVAPDSAATTGSPSIYARVKVLADEGLFGEAGAYGLRGWKTSAGLNGQGISPYASAGYTKGLGLNCAFSFGLGYMQVMNLASQGKVSWVSSYQFGEHSQVTVITPLTAHYLHVPLVFHYYLNRRHSIGTGVGISFLQTVVADVRTYEEGPGFSTEPSSVRLSGYNRGFAAADYQLLLSYRLRLAARLSLQASVLWGLNDVKDDAFFNIAHKERQTGARLSLVYYPFQKPQR